MIDDDLRINEERYTIERQCMLLLARQTPVAHDLHVVIALLNGSWTWSESVITPPASRGSCR